jgi:hypothetical protein
VPDPVAAFIEEALLAIANRQEAVRIPAPQVEPDCPPAADTPGGLQER